MDRRELYKTRTAGTRSNRAEQLRQQNAQKRANTRHDTHFNNRVIDEDSPSSPESGIGNTQASTVNRQKPKLPIADRIHRLRELRERNPNAVKEKRSPFVSTVPTGRVVPPKRSILEERMKKFRAKMEAASSTKKRRSTGKTKRRSVGSNKKAATGTKKPVTLPVNTADKPLKSSMKRRRSKVTSPVAGPSNEPKFAIPSAPANSLVPMTVADVKLEVATPQIVAAAGKRGPSFNVMNSFVTSTVTKGSGGGKIVSKKEDVSNFFNDISPLPEDSFEEPAAAAAAVVQEQLNKTFTTDESPLDTAEPVQDVAAPRRRSSQKVDTPKAAAQSNEKDLDQSQTNTQERAKRRRWSDVLNEIAVAETSQNASLPLPVIESTDGNRSKLRRLTTTDADADTMERIVTVKRFTEVLDATVQRFNGLVTIWTEYKDGNELEEVATDMINTAIGQSELLMRKKFAKFRDLIESYEKKDERVRADDLEGFWNMVNIEVLDIDRRFEELNKWKNNEWTDPVEIQQRKVVKAKRPTKKAGKATEALKAMISVMRKNKVAPTASTSSAPDKVVTPPRSARSQDTPKRHTPKRRSLNCSGCTPRKSVKKSLLSSNFLEENYLTPNQSSPISRHSMVLRSRCSSVTKQRCLLETSNEAAAISTDTPSTEPKRKSTRKSTKKQIFAELSSPTKTPAQEKILLKNVLKSAIEQSTKKRGSKTVLLAVDENTPSPSVTKRAETFRKRVVKTPKASRVASVGFEINDENENMENVNASVASYHTPIDLSKVTMTRGRSTRRQTPIPAASPIMTDDEDQDTPVLPMEVKGKRRSTRLFS